MERDTAPGPGKRALMAISAALFLALSVKANLPHTSVPLSQLGLFGRWDMFAQAPVRSLLVAAGTPRDVGQSLPRDAGQDLVVLDDPADRGRPWLVELRDQRQKKLHRGFEHVLRHTRLRQSYLAYLCRVHGERVASVALVPRDPSGALGRPSALLSCDDR